MIDIRPFTWNGWKSSVRYTYLLSLSDNIWNTISRKTRNVIRKGEKSDITITNRYDPESFWELNTDTYTKQNINVPFTKNYLNKLMDTAIDNNFGEIWIAEMPDGNIASIEFILWDKNMVHRWTAASNSQYKCTGVTSLLLYNISVEMRKRGFDCINLMAANTPQLTMFVSGFNPIATPYYEVSKSSLPIIGNLL